MIDNIEWMRSTIDLFEARHGELEHRGSALGGGLTQISKVMRELRKKDIDLAMRSMILVVNPGNYVNELQPYLSSNKKDILSYLSRRVQTDAAPISTLMLVELGVVWPELTPLVEKAKSIIIDNVSYQFTNSWNSTYVVLLLKDLVLLKKSWPNFKEDLKQALNNEKQRIMTSLLKGIQSSGSLSGTPLPYMLGLVGVDWPELKIIQKSIDADNKKTRLVIPT